MSCAANASRCGGFATIHLFVETLYGRATLAEYATWCAKILRAELHFEAEAQEALELKAKLEAK